MPTVDVSSSPPAIHVAFPAGKGASQLEELLRQWAQTTPPWDLMRPLPSSRAIGILYGISNVSVCRLLKRLELEQVVWQGANGRYFLPASRSLLQRPKNYACLSAAAGTSGYEPSEIMAAWSRRIDARDSSTRVVHHEAEVERQGDPIQADGIIAAQRRFLRDFFADPQGAWDGLLFDAYWRDEALAAFPHRLSQAVMVGRASALATMASVSMDVDAAALLGLAHLYARGYREIRVVGSTCPKLPQRQLVAALGRAAERLGMRDAAMLRPVSVEDVDREGRDRIPHAGIEAMGLFCLDELAAEDAARRTQPSRATETRRWGILAAASNRRLEELQVTRLTVDHGEAARRIDELFRTGGRTRVLLEPSLTIGRTT